MNTNEVKRFIRAPIEPEIVKSVVDSCTDALRRVTEEPEAYVEVLTVEGNAITAIAHIPLRFINIEFTVDPE